MRDLGHPAVGHRHGAARPAVDVDPPVHVAVYLEPGAVRVAEAVIERVVVRVAVDADDRDAADAGLADLPEGRVDDEETCGCRKPVPPGQMRALGTVGSVACPVGEWQVPASPGVR
jgi:hypothetical protein